MTRWPDPQPLYSGAEVWAAEFPASLSWELPSGSTVTVDRFEASGSAVSFWVAVLRPTGETVFEDDHVIVNPPVLNGEREPLDILAFVRALVEEHLP